MAYQIGLPVLILREESGYRRRHPRTRSYSSIRPIDLDEPVDEYFSLIEWNEMLGRWEGFVRMVFEMNVFIRLY